MARMRAPTMVFRIGSAYQAQRPCLDALATLTPKEQAQKLRFEREPYAVEFGQRRAVETGQSTDESTARGDHAAPSVPRSRSLRALLNLQRAPKHPKLRPCRRRRRLRLQLVLGPRDGVRHAHQVAP